MIRLVAISYLCFASLSIVKGSIIEEAARQYKEITGSEMPQSPAFKVASSDDFEDFIKQYNKEYRNEIEKQYRFKVFKVNNLLAQVYQTKDQGTAIYGTTKFSDMTREEFRLYYRNLQISATFEPSGTASIPNIKAPASVDWRKKGAVTAVKNQAQCGSCWAFSTTGNLEGQWFIKKGKLISLSEQQIVDCDKACYGCGGGFPFLAFEYIKQTGGIESESEYGYTARDGQCKFDKSKVVATLNGYVNLTSNEGEMATWCAANGPISIAVNANQMQLYKGGIARPTRESCDPRFLDHAILIVGYDVDHDQRKGDIPYWIVKNSWGADWGEKGYWLVYRGDGACGLNRQTASAVVD